MKNSTLKENIYSHFINQVKEYAIFAMDVNGVITSWNEGAERMKGYSEKEIIGQFYGILFKEDDQADKKPEEELKAAEEQGQFEVEAWRRKKDGSLFYAGITLTSIRNDSGELVGFTKVTKDLTEKKRHDDVLLNKHEELTTINKDLDTFIYTASHDLKAPIMNIDALVQRLIRLYEKKAIKDPELEELTNLMQNSVSRFKNTIEELTTITRLQRSLEEENNEEQVNVKEVYENIMADIHIHHEQSNFPCNIETDFQVLTFNFSRKNFRSVFYNLLSNAIKYRSVENGCEVKVQTLRENDSIVLVVKDNGLGMSERSQEQLFTMFKRFHDHVEGSGIGLYIVKRIIDNAGGSIKVNSAKGEGTEFKVYFNV